MFRRSRAREVALQVLFQRDAPSKVSAAAVTAFLRDRLRDQPSIDYAQSLLDGVTARAAEIDQHISKSSENWRLSRMSGVDRNVLRLGTLELLQKHPDVPAEVVLNEAIELARRFGSSDSPSFVNGVLDAINKSLADAGQ